jgi:transcriptional regulator
MQSGDSMKKQARTFITDEEEAVIAMRFSGLSHEKIASILGKSIAAVKKTEKRAWTNLKRSYATINHWDLIVASAESMKNINDNPIKHSLADVMT